MIFKKYKLKRIYQDPIWTCFSCRSIRNHSQSFLVALVLTLPLLINQIVLFIVVRTLIFKLNNSHMTTCLNNFNLMFINFEFYNFLVCITKDINYKMSIEWYAKAKGASKKKKENTFLLLVPYTFWLLFTNYFLFVFYY